MSRPASHPPGYENAKWYDHLLPGEYEIRVECSNCGELAYVAVPRGRAAKKAASFLICRNCGCTTMKVAMS